MKKYRIRSGAYSNYCVDKLYFNLFWMKIANASTYSRAEEIIQDLCRKDDYFDENGQQIY
jgi:hypothetical protein